MTTILSDLANKYGACKSYKDSGVILNTNVEQFVRQPEMFGPMIRFETEFERGSKFVFECMRSDGSEKLGIIYDTNHTLVRSSAADRWHESSLEGAIEETIKTTRGACTLIPLLLMFELRRSIPSPLFGRKYVEKRGSSFNGRPCIVIHSGTSNDGVALFIDRETQLISLIEETYTTEKRGVRSYLYMYQTHALQPAG